MKRTLLFAWSLGVQLSAQHLPPQASQSTVPLPPVEQSGWSAVTHLPFGARVTVGMKQLSRDRHGILISSDDSEVILLDGDAVSGADLRLLLLIAADHRDLFTDNTPHEMVAGSVRVGADGVFVGDRKLGDLDHVVTRIARDEIEKVFIKVRTRGSAKGALLGGSGGLAGTILLGGVLGQSAAGEPWLIIMPVAGALVGGFAGSTDHSLLLYRAP